MRLQKQYKSVNVTGVKKKHREETIKYPHKNCTADLKQVFKVFTYKLILNVGLEYIFCKLLFGSFFLPA